MPHITVKGMPENEVLQIQSRLMKTVSEKSGADLKYVRLDYMPSVQIGNDKKSVKAEILWLKGRSQEVQDSTASAVYEIFKDMGYEEIFVTFTNMPPEDFYENGVHY